MFPNDCCFQRSLWENKCCTCPCPINVKWNGTQWLLNGVLKWKANRLKLWILYAILVLCIYRVFIPLSDACSLPTTHTPPYHPPLISRNVIIVLPAVHAPSVYILALYVSTTRLSTPNLNMEKVTIEKISLNQTEYVLKMWFYMWGTWYLLAFLHPLPPMPS